MENNLNTRKPKRYKTQTVVGMGMLTAVIVVLQIVASQIKFGPFSITLCLAPIIIGAALYGWKAGAWLGFVFGLTVLLTGDAALFMTINVPGTIATVLLKGAVSGVAGGAVYGLLEKKGEFIAVIISGIAAPIANTGVFLLGCVLFFLDACKEWGAGLGYDNVFAYLLLGMTGLNFLVELAINMVLSSAIVFIIGLVKKRIRTS